MEGQESWEEGWVLKYNYNDSLLLIWGKPSKRSDQKELCEGRESWIELGGCNQVGRDRTRKLGFGGAGQTPTGRKSRVTVMLTP